MILCEKCSEYFDPLNRSVFHDNCPIHGEIFISPVVKGWKIKCPQCAKEKGICQKCGCDLKTEGDLKETLYYCDGCGKDKPLEEMETDPNKMFMLGLCKKCNKLVTEE